MIRLGSIALVFALFCAKSAFARRGNPIANSNARIQYYIVDSDDDLASKPSYFFLDTTFGSWTRVTGFTHPDTGYARIVAPSPITFSFYDQVVDLPPRYVHANGFVTFDSVAPATIQDTLFQRLGKAANAALPQSLFSMLCPLWADLELRATGDSSKVFYRVTTDSCYVSFYNMALKGSNGRIRATFQIIFARSDSSITMQYRSFDGSIDGVSAASIFQRLATIGVQDTLGRNATNYLDRNAYYAFSRAANPSQYEANLHNGLAVKFRRFKNYLTLKEIVSPPFDGYELPTSTFQPGIRIRNNTDSTRTISILNEVFNTVGGVKVYARTDTLTVSANSEVVYTGVSSSLACGSYRMVSSVTAPSLGLDPWTHDNAMTREFVLLSDLSLPHLDDFRALNRCAYNAAGVTFSPSAEAVMRDPAAPYATGALVFDRKNAKGNYYRDAAAGDTLATSVINLQGKSNVWLIFSYQRGLRADSIQAGVRSRRLVGPEVRRASSNPFLTEGDSLVIEALTSSGSAWNPAASSWVQIGIITGGIDLDTKKFRLQIPSVYLHNHSRFRLRLAATDNGPFLGLPFDDADPFIVDGLQISAPALGNKNISELEPIGLDLGAKYYSHIPRDVKFITPKVKIASNGLQSNLAIYQVRLVLWDALGRQVYHQKRSLVAPDPHSDVELQMLAFPIEGSQGGVFTARVTIEQLFTDFWTANDTNTFYRTLAIDDGYAYDDGQPDTVGTMTAANHSWYYYIFRPLQTDSLRGMEFYHLTASGLSNWTLTFRNEQGNVRYTRALSYTALDRGFQRALFTMPVPLSADSTYIIQCDMTNGFALGGDASLGLVIPDDISGTSTNYWLLYPNVLNQFIHSTGTPYGTSSFVLNGLAGGPLLPMMRLVYRGSPTYLPVELLSLRAKRNTSGDVLIDFATASETETYNFTIDRFSNGGWQFVASLPAKNFAHGASYSMTDATAPSGELLYRLTSYDLDGSEHTLGAVAVGSSAQTDNKLRLSPNPARSSARIILPAAGRDMQARLYDEAGRLARNVTVDAANPQIDVEGLPQGMYVLEIIISGERFREKLWVQ